jgi:hypothetical protein
VQQPCGRKLQVFSPREWTIVVQVIIDNLFEEVLSFQVSSEYGGGHGTTEEELFSSVA